MSSRRFGPALAPNWQPSDHGLLGWTYDPAMAASSTGLTSGTVYLSRVVLRAPAVVSKIWHGVNTVAAAVTSGQNFFGLVDAAGTLLSSGSADAAIVAGTGPQSVNLGAAQALPAGLYWCALLANAGTPPVMSRTAPHLGVASAGLAAANYRFCVNGTGRTTLAASITPGSNTLTGASPFWAAVS